MPNLKKIGIYFRFKTLSILVIAILAIGGLWKYTSYSSFYRESRQLKQVYTASQKDLIQSKVSRIVDEIEHSKSKMNTELRENIREKGYEAYDIAINIYEENKNSKSKGEIKQIIEKVLSEITYNKDRGYFFGGSLEDGVLLFANDSEFGGKKLMDYRSPNGKYIFRDIQQILTSKGEGFYEYTWEHPYAVGNRHRKISFVKFVEPLNIWVGTGEYFEDFQYEQQQELLDRIKNITFGRNGYFFVSNLNGLKLTTGDKKQSYLIGTNEWESKDFNGKKLLQELAKVAQKKDGGFIRYKWHKPSKNEPEEKITFVKGISGWNWMVGTGIYLDDINDTVASKRKKLQIETIEYTVNVVFIILFLASWYYDSLLDYLFFNY